MHGEHEAFVSWIEHKMNRASRMPVCALARRQHRLMRACGAQVGSQSVDHALLLSTFSDAYFRTCPGGSMRVSRARALIVCCADDKRYVSVLDAAKATLRAMHVVGLQEVPCH